MTVLGIRADVFTFFWNSLGALKWRLSSLDGHIEAIRYVSCSRIVETLVFNQSCF
jgi:hypothetical protein